MTLGVGRVVHYTSYGSAGGDYDSECRAAIVTQVTPSAAEGESGTVGLAVLNPTGLFFRSAVVESSRRLPGTWHRPEDEPQIVTGIRGE